MMKGRYAEFVEFALELAQLAEREILSRFPVATVDRKPDGSEVTEADRSAERAIRERIADRYPTHGILGEEFGADNAQEQTLRWVIDPLDGTAWFALGVPTFGTLIALLEEDEPVVGVIHFPVTGETVYAGVGSGCWFKTRVRDPERLRVADPGDLSQAVISASGVHSTDLRTRDGHIPYRLSDVIKGAGVFRFCGDCLQHALVCRGRIHAGIDTLMQRWDTAAIVPCIERLAES